MKLVLSSYRLREMSGGFGETGEPHVEDDGSMSIGQKMIEQ